MFDKERKMNRSIVFRIISALVLIAALVGIGVFAFNAGLARGLVTNLPAPAASNGPAPLPYPYYGMHYGYGFPIFGFGCFGVLIPLFLLFLVFGAFRAMMWHGPRRWHMMHHGGPWGMHPSGEGSTDVPPMVAEWHRRMHEQPLEKKSE
jgi:hypothetical protein